MFKVKTKNTRTMRRMLFYVFINFEQISHLFSSVFIDDFE